MLSCTVRIPDPVNRLTKTIYEVNNATSVSLSSQIRDTAHWAQANGWTYIMYVRRGADGIQNLRNHGITVVEF